MKFFWPAPLDLIDPSYNFLLEQGNFGAAKHKQQKYPHEIFEYPPYHGFVISKIYFEKDGCRWNASQQNRFLREGAKRFLKFPHNYSLLVMGDSGAYTKSLHEFEDRNLFDECLEVIEYYNMIGVDYGLSPDHVIGGFIRSEHSVKDKRIEEWRKRCERTIKQASIFWALCNKKNVQWQPIGIAQGWDFNSYQDSVRLLQQIGYKYIALGGLAWLNSDDILKVVKTCNEVRYASTHFHLLGVGRIEYIESFDKYGVISFDSSAAVRQAINDTRRNYHWIEQNYLAIRVPQTFKSITLKPTADRYNLNKKELLLIEQASLDALRKFDKGEIELNDVIKILKEGITLRQEKDFLNEYERLLRDQPWKKCSCTICKEVGIEVVLLRNRERNLRRGFHNLYIFFERLQKKFPNHLNNKSMLKQKYLTIPAISFRQGKEKILFTFVVEGSRLKDFASVSRLSRKDDKEILGYQRPEVAAHISNITKYLQSENSLLPNSIVVAFENVIDFEPLEPYKSSAVQMGTLSIPIDSGQENFIKPAWIVDGQQRTAALSEAGRNDFHVNVVAFIAENLNQQREQFMLVNSTKPLSKALLYELLPYTECVLNDLFEKRRFPSALLERLNYEEYSPFYKKIKTSTNPKGIVQDNSILKMLDNSLNDGALYFLRENTKWATIEELTEKMLLTLRNFWTAVSETFTSAWTLPPNKSRLTHGAGIVSLGFIMDAIVDRKISKEPLEVSVFKSDLDKLAPVCRWTYGHWEFGPGAQRKWNGIQNTPTDIRTLSHYLLLQYKSLVWNDAIRYS